VVALHPPIGRIA